jgi:thiol:disulfide interchange protein DsbC
MTMTINKLRNALCLCLLGANLALPLPASAQTAAPTANSIAERLQSLYPATRFGAVNTTPWPGVFEVVMGANLAYVDESGQYFLFGHLFDMKAQRDLTAERKDAQTRVDFAALPLADAVKDVRGNGARTLAIFSDPDCPYCLKLETEIKSLTDVTIYTFLMPIASLHPGARSKAIAVWCSRDRVAAWRALMLRDMQPDDASPARECPHPVDRNIALGERLGISGTPTLVAATVAFFPVPPAVRRSRRGSRAPRPAPKARHRKERRAMNRAVLAPLLLVALTLAGCASTLSGVGGVDGYACKAPEGAMCTSVSGIYANSAQGMPKLAKPSAQKPPPDEPVAYGATPMAPGRAAAASSSLRSNPRLLRLWIAPWEDADGDLHEQALVHVVVDSGRWLIEHVRPATGSRVDGVAPPVSHVKSPRRESTGRSTASPDSLPAATREPVIRRRARLHGALNHVSHPDRRPRSHARYCQGSGPPASLARSIRPCRQ